MREIKLIYKKEFRDFFARKNMLARYTIILLISILFAALPTQQLPITQNRPLLVFWYMLFALFAVIGFLSVDVIGSEKTQKTLETLLSVPLKLSNVFFGMTAFMFTIAFGFLCLVTVYDNVWLYLIFHQSFALISAGWPLLIMSYLLAVLSILLMIQLGLVITLFSRNFRATRYIMLVLGFILIYGMNVFMQHFTPELSLIVAVSFLLLLALIFMSIYKHVNKQYALKFAR